MCSTLGAAAVAALCQRVCLFAPSVNVCVVVCVRLTTCVAHAGPSDELWRFSTFTLQWEQERGDSTAANGPGPSARWNHVMSSVGLDLWVHGGAVVCVPFTTCVSHEGLVTGLSDELWRFSTSTLGWERVDSTATNGARPSARWGHVMSSVGLDLWVHGGDTSSGEGDGCWTHLALLL
jgi:hypothetical protein